MSHFTVMVVGKDPDYQLAPFHKFECTGLKDEFLELVDETEEFIKIYETNTTKVIKNKLTGESFYGWEDMFFRDPTEEEKKEIGLMMGSGFSNKISYTSKDWGDGLGYRTKVKYIPKGYVEQEVTYQEKYLSFEEFLREYEGIENFFKDLKEANKKGIYSFALMDDEDEVKGVYRFTNPNAKWDWYSIGGRWSGFLLNNNGEKVDSALKKDIDFESMKKEAVEEARKDYELVEDFFGGEIPKIKTLKEFDFNKESSREEYYNQEPLEKFLEFMRREKKYFCSFDDYQISKEEYLDKAAKKSIMTFAILKDRVWHERGEMGWWASVSDEKDDWEDIFNDVLKGVDENELITIVDCHI